jgi:hypothetical protein
MIFAETEVFLLPRFGRGLGKREEVTRRPENPLLKKKGNQSWAFGADYNNKTT